MLSKKTGYTYGEIRALREIGKLNEVKGNYDVAIDIFHQCIDLSDSIDNQMELGKAYFSLGETLFRTNQSREAQEALNIALDIFRAEGEPAWVAGALNSLGNIYLGLQEPKKSLFAFKKAFHILDSLDSPNKITPLTNIGYHYLMIGEAKAALPYVQLGLNTCRESGDILGIATSYGNLGYTYGLLGRLDASVKNYQHCIDTSLKYNYPSVLSTTYKDMSETYENFGYVQEALKYYKLHHQLQDSLIGVETLNRIADLNVKFETEQKNKELALHQSEIKALHHQAQYDRLQKTILIIVGILLATIAWLVYAKMKGDIKKRREVHQLEKQLINRKLEEETLEKQNIRQELDYKSKYLTDYALEIVQKNQFLDDLINRLNSLQKLNPESVPQRIKDLSIFAISHLKVNEQVKLFQQGVEEVNLDFYQKLEEEFPSLSQNDRQLCGLIRLNLHSKEIAALRNVSPEAVKMARYRLRKKLNLQAEDDIVKFLKTIS